MVDHYEHSLFIDLENPDYHTRDLKKIDEAWSQEGYHIRLRAYQDWDGKPFVEIFSHRGTRKVGLDITREWKKIIEELNGGNIPAWLVQKATNNQWPDGIKLQVMTTKREENDMVTKDAVKEITTEEVSRYLEQKKQEQEVVNKESVNTEEVAPVEVPDEIVASDNSAVVQPVHDETGANSEESTFAESISNEADDEEVWQSTERNADGKINPNKSLPVIKPDDKRVTLCVRDEYRLEMMPLYNADSMIVENLKLFLINVNTNIPMIGATDEMQIAKDKIMKAPDYTVLNIIRKFVINFTDDDIKIAFDRAKTFLEISRSMLGVNYSMNIVEAYREVVKRAIERAKCEDNATDSRSSDGRHYKYDPEEKMVSIRDRFMKELLEETGYTPVIFCKKLCMIETCMGVKILKRNTGRYAYNEVGNQRFYKLRIIDELMAETEVA